MEIQRSSGTGSGKSGTYTPEISESLRFEEEIQSLIHPSFDGSPRTGCSFTALLGLPAHQAVELLHEPSSGMPPAPAAASSSPTAAGLWQFRLGEHETAAAPPLDSAFVCSPTFPSDTALLERAARFSVFATEDSPASSSCGGPSPSLKAETLDSDPHPTVPILTEKPQRPAKRKEIVKKSKAKTPTKKRKSAEENTGGEKPPYVHVRARRGEATDSHSLAERARREKINARMKLLQELVPGCSKITGTASVLDEIINHVQSLQRQVELLSMRLAAVNPRIDCSLDGFLSGEFELLTAGNGRGLPFEPAMWASDVAVFAKRMPQQQFWHLDLVRPHQSSQLCDRDGSAQLNHETSLYVYDSTNSVFLCSRLNLILDAVKAIGSDLINGPMLLDLTGATKLKSDEDGALNCSRLCFHTSIYNGHMYSAD